MLHLNSAHNSYMGMSGRSSKRVGGEDNYAFPSSMGRPEDLSVVPSILFSEAILEGSMGRLDGFSTSKILLP